MPTDEQITRWLTQIDAQTYAKTLPLGGLLFEPAEETSRLLTQWLHFRKYPLATLATLPHSELVRISKMDMEQHGNSPPFTQFVDFDPAAASEDFLVMWLSWFGVTSVQAQSKVWWVQISQKIQRLVHASHDPGDNPHLLFLSTEYAHRLLEQGRAQLACTHSILDSLPGGHIRSVGSVGHIDPSGSIHSKRASLAKHALAHLLGIAAITIPIIKHGGNIRAIIEPEKIHKFATLLKTDLIGRAQTMIVSFYLLWIMSKVTKRIKNPIIHDYAVAATKDLRRGSILPANLIKQVITNAFGMNPTSSIVYEILNASTQDAWRTFYKEFQSKEEINESMVK